MVLFQTLRCHRIETQALGATDLFLNQKPYRVKVKGLGLVFEPEADFMGFTCSV